MSIEQSCRHQVGFIFKGDCGKQADAFCNNCARPVCRKHCRVNRAQINCAKCSKDLFDLELDDSASPDTRHSHNDPYMYHQHSDSTHAHSSQSSHVHHTTHEHHIAEGAGSEFTESDRSNFVTESQSDGGGSYEQSFSGS